MILEDLLTVDGFIKYLQYERRLSAYTVRNYKKAIDTFLNWLGKNEKDSFFSLNDTRVKAFVIEMQRQYSRRTVHNYVSGLRMYYEYLLRHQYIQNNPWVGLSLPRLDKKLPKFLTEKQMFKLLQGPKLFLEKKAINPMEAARDQLVLELLYGGGLRVSEAANLNYGQIEESTQSLRIIGKGNKERICPIGSNAWEALLDFKMTFSSKKESKDCILINTDNKPLGVRGIQNILKKYLKLAELPMDITPHKIRHSCATHLINHGMDIRVLQSFLGHSSLSATQVYTHLDMTHLKKTHAKAHPRA